MRIQQSLQPDVLVPIVGPFGPTIGTTQVKAALGGPDLVRVTGVER